MRKLYKRCLALALAAVLCAGTACPALAAESTPKEEVVYASLDGSGAVEAVYVVNIFDLVEAGTITDYGDYSALRNMTGTEEISYDGDTVTIEADAGKLYYEGTLENARLPWIFEIHYYLDGAEYDAADLAGQSGELEITLSIRENPACTGDFFESYALEISLTLDTALCANITAEGATVANVGGDKQLTYIVLPGNEKDFTITASVTDFVMDGIDINGIPLALDVEVDDEALMEQITSLMEAIEALDDGAGELDDGVSELETSVETELASGTESLTAGASALESGAASLQSGVEEVSTGAAALTDGAETLEAGLETLNQGVAQLQTGLEALDSESQALTEGSAQVKAALAALQSALAGVSASSDTIETLTATAQTMQASLDALSAQNEAAAQQIESLLQIAGGLGNVTTTAINAALGSMGIDMTVSDGVTLASGLVTLLESNNEAIAQIETFMDTVSAELSDTLTALGAQITALSAAIDALAEKYDALDSGIGDYTDGVAQILAGYEQLAAGVDALTGGSSALTEGATSLYDGVSELLAGIVSVYEATGTLSDGAGQLDSGVAALLEAVRTLYSGTEELKEGTSAMREDTDGMDETIQQQIDDLLASVTGGEVETASFVSEKNTGTEAVQFIITTPAIETAAETAAESETEEELTFWQKLLDLF
ncbi:MAG: hypothetical protein LJU34_03970 [Oscillospiraceae bacterium]|nr:hypothetical protein [Oscillospiraceae bacterium]